MNLRTIVTVRTTPGRRISRIVAVAALIAALLGAWTWSLAGSLIDVLRNGDPESESQLSALDQWSAAFFVTALLCAAAAVAFHVAGRPSAETSSRT
jgi:hypothetical protein